MVNIKDNNFYVLDREDPELSKHLSLLWGHKEFTEYIFELTHNYQYSSKFSIVVISALAALAARHHEQFQMY